MTGALDKLLLLLTDRPVADTSVTPEEAEAEPGTSSGQRSAHQQSAPLGGLHAKLHDGPLKERMVSKDHQSSAMSTHSSDLRWAHGVLQDAGAQMCHVAT